MNNSILDAYFAIKQPTVVNISVIKNNAIGYRQYLDFYVTQ